ncbi:MAG: HAMP domain-containing sensor histidine kinase [Elusimicrobia bacterium]|nr:HAMP domain-containing sensor histidine kinase [Elusimicrobiota bacterium]
MSNRRGVYFAFQGLLVAVLLLIFAQQRRGLAGWPGHFGLLAAVLGASLVLLRLAPERTLSRWYFQVSLFLGDAAAASVILHWTRPDSDLFLIYFLIIFGTALTRSLAQSLAVAFVTSALYLLSAWRPGAGLPADPGFWLRANLLWVSSALLTILARDSRQAQREQQRRYQERLVQFERLATLGRVAGEVAHRIKGPLTTIMVDAEVLARTGAGLKEKRELAQIREEAARCRDILKGLLDLGRIEEMDRQPFDLREALRGALKAAAPLARRRGLRLDSRLGDRPLAVAGDFALIQDAVGAVLHNAVEAGRDGGCIRVEAGAARGGWFGGGPGLWEVVVEDDGRGIAAGDLERVFEPFFTTKGAQGSGLGLSAALRIFQKHGGFIEAQSDGPGRGARFTLSVPGAAVP